MAEKLTWNEIEKLYDHEWIELVDFDWPDMETHPINGVVRVHTKSRIEFDKLINLDPPESSAYVFVGKRELKPGEIVSLNRHQVQIDNA
jgi:hypothetical protein